MEKRFLELEPDLKVRLDIVEVPSLCLLHLCPAPRPRFDFHSLLSAPFTLCISHADVFLTLPQLRPHHRHPNHILSHPSVLTPENAKLNAVKRNQLVNDAIKLVSNAQAIHRLQQRTTSAQM